MAARKNVILAASLLCLVLLLPGRSHGQQSPIPIQDQEKILFDSIEEVLKRHPEAAKDVRLLGIGSWMAGKAGPASDIDATLGHPDKKVQEELVAEINQVISEKTQGRAQGIKLIRDGDPHFDELFRGDPGRKFIRDYANRNSATSCFLWDKDEATGSLVRRNTFTERFWTDRKISVPRVLTRPETFVEDSALFLKKVVDARDLSLVDKALDAAKYMNNVDGWLKDSLKEQYGLEALPGRQMNATLEGRMKALLAIKNAKGLSEAERRTSLMKIFGVTDETALQSKLTDFIGDAGRQLAGARDRVEMLDYLKRTGTLSKVGNRGAAVELGESLMGRLAKGAGKAVALADVYVILDKYYSEGPDAALTQTLMTLIAMGVPEAAAAQLVAEVGGAVLVGGVTLAGNYFIFDPLNESMLKKVYDRGNAFGIFSTWEDNPFRGVLRETLYYHFPKASREDVEPVLRAGVNRYVSELAVIRGKDAGLFADAGAGDFKPALLAQLLNDWETSRKIAWNVEVLETKLLVGERRPAMSPLEIMVEDRLVQSGQPAELRKTADGEAVSFYLDVKREFDALRRLPPDMKPRVYDYWGHNGYSATTFYIQGAMDSYTAQNGGFDRGYGEPVAVTISLEGAKGWILSGSWPLKLPDLASGSGTAKGELELAGSGFDPFLIKTYPLRLSPTAEATGPVRITMEFQRRTISASKDKPGSAPQEPVYRLVLTVEPGKRETKKAMVPSPLGGLGWAGLMAEIAPIYLYYNVFPEPEIGATMYGYAREKLTSGYLRALWTKTVEKGTCEVAKKPEPYLYRYEVRAQPEYLLTNSKPPAAGQWPAARDSYVKWSKTYEKQSIKKIDAGDAAYVAYGSGSAANAAAWRGPFKLGLLVVFTKEGRCSPPEREQAWKERLGAEAGEMTRAIMERFDQWYFDRLADGPGVKGLYAPFDVSRYAPTPEERPAGSKLLTERLSLVWNWYERSSRQVEKEGILWQQEYLLGINSFQPEAKDASADEPLKKARTWFEKTAASYEETFAKGAAVMESKAPEKIVLPGSDEAMAFVWRPKTVMIGKHYQGGHILLIRRANVVMIASVTQYISGTTRPRELFFPLEPDPDNVAMAKRVLEKLIKDKW